MKFTLCTAHGAYPRDLIITQVGALPGVVAATHAGRTSYRRSALTDLDLYEVETSDPVRVTVERAVGALRARGVRVWRYIPRAGNRKRPAAQPKLNLTEEELKRASTAAALDGIRPTGRSGGFPELVTNFIQLMNDRYEELEAEYGAERLESIDPRDPRGTPETAPA
jgi:hypothetical protein